MTNKNVSKHDETPLFYPFPSYIDSNVYIQHVVLKYLLAFEKLAVCKQ